ncbi:MAG: RNA-binding domain-containing protein [Candidatus Korobacteraceae bacterium]
MDLQELIARGRFIFQGAPERLRLFSLVDGRKTPEEIARKTKRHVNNVHRDLRRLADVGLIAARTKDDQVLKKDGFRLYEKTPLARTVPISYFTAPTKIPKPQGSGGVERNKKTRPRPLPLPSETDILDMCKKGEDQTLEFKAAGTDVRKITKEVAGMLNTRQGGIILYGVDDDGAIHGSDVSRQKFDQPLQNSIKSSIAPAAIVALKAISVLGSEVLAVVVPPWNRKDVYQFDEKVYIRKGTNVFGVKPEELRKLHKGEGVV